MSRASVPRTAADDDEVYIKGRAIYYRGVDNILRRIDGNYDVAQVGPLISPSPFTREGSSEEG